MINKNIFVRLFVSSNITWLKIFYINDITKKEVCVVFNVYIFNTNSVYTNIFSLLNTKHV